MNVFQMVVLIVAIVSVTSIMRARHGIRRDAQGNEYPIADPDADRLRTEVKTLRDRVAVLERIATENDRGISLDREIEALRRRD